MRDTLFDDVLRRSEVLESVIAEPKDKARR
jgi:hypothetical protein